MNIKMNFKTQQWIEKNGGILKLDPFHPLQGNKSKRCIDALISYNVPENAAFYTEHCIGDIKVYVHSDIATKDKLGFHLSGFGPFQHLNVNGIKRFYKKETV
ncbi:hypothetical protein [Salsuginibacillus kocurii]|uniref:hypothetical protein n=1 Tax=Salsuginibacillus kocurii TaxID=427078 RepID=UPI0003760215|nr:hypothetical protein [Salsuginibacillus kocurii]